MSRLLMLVGLALLLVLGGASLVVAQGDAGQEAEDTGAPGAGCPSPEGVVAQTTGGSPEASPTPGTPEPFGTDATPASSPGATPAELACPSPGAGS